MDESLQRRQRTRYAVVSLAADARIDSSVGGGDSVVITQLDRAPRFSLIAPPRGPPRHAAKTLALMFFFEMRARRIDEIAARHDAGERHRFAIGHHRHALQAMHREARGDEAARFARQRDRGRVAGECVADRHVAADAVFRVSQRDQRFAIGDADQPIAAHDRVGAMALIRAEEGGERIAQRERGIDRLDLARHDFVDMVPLERIDAVLAIDVITAARDFFRHDRTLHDDGCEAVRHEGRRQQR